jgi:hypothetical protein
MVHLNKGLKRRVSLKDFSRITDRLKYRGALPRSQAAKFPPAHLKVLTKRPSKEKRVNPFLSQPPVSLYGAEAGI